MLSIDITIIAVWINFLIYVWLMNRFFFRPVVNHLDERKDKIRKAREHAEMSREKVSAIQDEYGKKITAEQRNSLRTVEARIRDGLIRRKKLLQEAEDEVIAILNKTDQEVERQITILKDRSRDSITHLAQEIVGKVL